MNDNQTIAGDQPEDWSRASSAYAEHIAPRMMQPFAEQFADLVDADKSMKVLEVAAGSGALTPSLAKRAGSVLATDYAADMVGVLSHKLAQAGIDNVTCEVMNGEALSLADNSFDRAASSFGLMLFGNRKAGFSELNRVVKPGGRVMVSVWGNPEEFQAFSFFMNAIRTAFPDLPAPTTPPAVFSLSDRALFQNEMEGAGFKGVEITPIMRVMQVDSVESIWHMATSGAPPVQKLFDKVGHDGRARVLDALHQITKERFGSGPIRLHNTALAATAEAN